MKLDFDSKVLWCIKLHKVVKGEQKTGASWQNEATGIKWAKKN